MSVESSPRIARPSSSARGTVVQKNFSTAQKCKFGTVVLALWPSKPALNLSQRIGCTERAANLYITGKRKPSARAVLAVNSAFFE